ncbi:nitrogen fixation protein NifQ [Rhizobium grahamii]|uniref:Nitrogen fixation protein, NifQ2 n=1 Tax=Rhizobium grahamii CCGE 502 TaxID=990285 RepID=S3HJJ5_9HYPH|nr:nitrogen fixation protein NifQ [Rhizobium grahamii]EPE93716.1 nitrogen fixation protein, NifQ2 [Rhizobium grahamii CCGE 502]
MWDGSENTVVTDRFRNRVVRTVTERSSRRKFRLADTWGWPRMDVEMDFDDYVLARIFSRALEEVEAGEASVTEATGLSREEVKNIVYCCFPLKLIGSLAIDQIKDPEPGVEEGLLRDILLAHACPDSQASVRFAKIVARRCMRDGHLWQELGLAERGELHRLMATHFPRLAAGNKDNMRWKKYLYRTICESEGFALCKSPGCSDCADREACFEPDDPS